MYGLPPPLPIDMGSIGLPKSTLCIRLEILANSRLRAVSSASVILVYVALIDY